MALLRPLVILLVLFGGMYYFRTPLSRVAPAFSALHSPYADTFKKLFKEVTTATSSVLLGGNKNYVPSLAGTVISTGSKTTTTDSIQDTKPIVAPKTDLLPVISNQKEGVLTSDGIVLFTNRERTKAGLPSLSINPKLKQAAEAKLKDMFRVQYFQHISPSGESVSDVARKNGYEYIVVGENLALGIFAGDEQVVSAWMASPGHKKNILDPRYQDIGIAVGRGMYQGREQWLIVQHFGKPLTSCAYPDAELKQGIEEQRSHIDLLETKISALRTEVSQLSGDAYTAKAAEYNTLVVDYNERLETLRKDVEKYNESARAFNVCAGIKA
jgi:uncharacterized protein YkwD